MINYYGVFPSLISIQQFSRDFNTNEKNCFETAAFFNDYSLDHEPPTQIATTREINIIRDYELVDLEKFILDSVKDYAFNFLQVKDDIDYFINKSWIVKSKPGGYGRIHTHPNSLLSGVIYYKAPKKSGNLLLYSGSPTTFGNILFGTSSSNYFNSSIVSIEPLEGKMVLFPSNMQHEVAKNDSNNERISLSFDIWYTGTPTQTTNIIVL